MLIGGMNHPARDIASELKWMSELELDFVDLTLEPPAASPWNIQPAEIKRRLQDLGMGVVGHTAYYLPIGSAFESIRRAASEELKRCVDIFAHLGARWMNIHPDSHVPFHDHAFAIQRNVQTLQEVLAVADGLGIGLMLENVPGKFNSAEQLGEVLDALPELGLHLDIGHCNLLTDHNTSPEILNRFSSRLRHVHLHDNKGGSADLHLPLGTGTLEVAKHVTLLRQSGYDGTVTLEVFSEDRHYFAHSRDVLRERWDAAGKVSSPAGRSLEPAALGNCSNLVSPALKAG